MSEIYNNEQIEELQLENKQWEQLEQIELLSNNNSNDDVFVINKNIKNIYVSYIVNNITWKSKCIGLLNNNDKTINFKIIGSISNTNDRCFKGKTQTFWWNKITNI